MLGTTILDLVAATVGTVALEMALLIMLSPLWAIGGGVSAAVGKVSLAIVLRLAPLWKAQGGVAAPGNRCMSGTVVGVAMAIRIVLVTMLVVPQMLRDFCR